jgi:nucleotide-binding universal stress UspA family protein
MTTAKKVLACVDQSHFADTVADYAAWAAARLAAPLEFLHVIDRHPERATGHDHSGAIGVDAQAHLLAELAEQDAARSKALREQGRLFLNRLRERALASGVAMVDVRQRHGSLESGLVEQEREVGLFVLGRRGESAETTQRDLGRNVEWVVRALHQPILTVTEGFTPPTRLMIAFDGSKVTRRGIEWVAINPLLAGLPVHVLMSGQPAQDAPAQLEWAQRTLANRGFDVSVSMIPGDAETVIARAAQEQGIDLLIMGAYAHSPWRRLFSRSKTTDILRASRIPTLLLRAG